MRRHISSLVTLSYIITSSYAVPYDSSATLQARSVNCSDLHAPTDSTCWQGLDLTAWLTNWNKTTPTCNEDQDGADCCQVGEAWNRCFLRLAHGSAGSDCTQINAQACTWNQYLAVDRNIAPQVFYVMTNIYCILTSRCIRSKWPRNDILTRRTQH